MNDQEVLKKLWEALDALKANKPNDRSELDRRYAVAITDQERVIAWFAAFIVAGDSYQRAQR